MAVKIGPPAKNGPHAHAAFTGIIVYKLSNRHQQGVVVKDNSRHLMSRTKPTHADRSGGEIGCCTKAILNRCAPIYFGEESTMLILLRFYHTVLRREMVRD